MAICARQAARRHEEFARLSNHFIDSLRGLETLRLFGRSREQAGRIYATSERFRATLGENLAFYRPDAGDGEIRDAARKLGLRDLIDERHTLLFERFDRVVLLEDGRIAADGAPGELARGNERFVRLLAFDRSF